MNQTIATLLFCLFVSFYSCTPTAQTRRSYFLTIFQDEASTFRGLRLGDEVEKIKALNPTLTPQFQDILGLRYSVDIEKEGKNILIDYYLDNLKTGKESNHLTAIHVKVEWGDEVETADLYAEIHRKFIRKYGLPVGAYGDWVWEVPSYQMEVSLRLAPDRHTIYIQFIQKI
jgi:hypothetical protein